MADRRGWTHGRDGVFVFRTRTLSGSGTHAYIGRDIDTQELYLGIGGSVTGHRLDRKAMIALARELLIEAGRSDESGKKLGARSTGDDDG